MRHLQEAKASLSIPDAWHRLNLSGRPGKSCRSPFRDDRSPSFSIFDDGSRWHDHATDEGGDVADFVAMALNVNLSDAAKWLLAATGQRTAAPNWPQPLPPSTPKPKRQRQPLRLPAMDKGTITELFALQHQRGLEMFAGLEILIRRGQLGFANLEDGDENPRCWIIYEPERSANARRLDGRRWQSLPGEPKAKTLAGSKASWPLGTRRISKTNTILFCEGTPDLLAAATWALYELDAWEAVAMPGRMPIHEDALPCFQGKSVFMFAHNDQPGLDSARIRSEQLLKAGASVTVLCSEVEGRDLNDALNANEKISLT